MSTATLPVSTIVQVSIAAPQPGLLVPNVNNICILDTETPAHPENLTALIGVYSNSAEVGVDWGTSSEAYKQAVAIFSQRPNILAGGGQLVIYYMTGSIVTLLEAITAVEALIYVGAYLWAGYNPVNAEIEAAVATVNGLGKLIGVSTYLTSDLTAGNLLYVVSAANEPSGVLFLYTQGGTYLAARLAMAAVFSAQMSTNFAGQNTTLNLNVKTLQGVTADTGITPAVLTTCQTLGVNVYASIQGVAKFIANGGPNFIFMDNVYNLLWFANALQIGIFNALAMTSTKIPQTEAGMTVLKNAVIAVCQQAVLNGYIAPGTWQSTDTFGDLKSFLRNIVQLGYYIYSQPIGDQSEAVRETRAAPLMQLAVKLAGAINTASLLVFFNP
jgi:hypothetical protein